MSTITAISPTHAVAPRASERRPPAVVAAALPDMPKPVTPATAGVHLMQVPSSRVIEVLASLQRALGQQVQVNRASDDTAQRWARAAAPAAPAPAVDLQA
jgi:hypothetical protein